jgi:hypothetical protein
MPGDARYAVEHLDRDAAMSSGTVVTGQREG